MRVCSGRDRRDARLARAGRRHGVAAARSLTAGAPQLAARARPSDSTAVIVWHGTTIENKESIERDGLRTNSYVASTRELAESGPARAARARIGRRRHLRARRPGPAVVESRAGGGPRARCCCRSAASRRGSSPSTTSTCATSRSSSRRPAWDAWRVAPAHPTAGPPRPTRSARIVAIADPVIRNLQITHCYGRLSAAMAQRTGPCANWCTYATWASRQAGRTIRGEDLIETLRTRLRVRPQLLHPLASLGRMLLRRGLFNPHTMLGRLTAQLHTPFDVFEAHERRRRARQPQGLRGDRPRVRALPARGPARTQAPARPSSRRSSPSCARASRRTASATSRRRSRATRAPRP